MPTDIARYSIELFKQGGEGIEQVIDRHADIKVARSIYQTSVKRYPGRLIMLCDGARVLARSVRGTDGLYAATDGHFGSAARHCELAARLARDRLRPGLCLKPQLLLTEAFHCRVKAADVGRVGECRTKDRTNGGQRL